MGRAGLRGRVGLSAGRDGRADRPARAPADVASRRARSHRAVLRRGRRQPAASSTGSRSTRTARCSWRTKTGRERARTAAAVPSPSSRRTSWVAVEQGMAVRGLRRSCSGRAPATLAPEQAPLIIGAGFRRRVEVAVGMAGPFGERRPPLPHPSGTACRGGDVVSGYRLGDGHGGRAAGVLPCRRISSAVIEAPWPRPRRRGRAAARPTMAGAHRLVANGFVAPQDAGLTFTRKAAASLAERLGRRINAASIGWSPAPMGGAGRRGRVRRRAAGRTYNASRALFRETPSRRPRAGRRGDRRGRLPALARRVVVEHGDARLPGSTRAWTALLIARPRAPSPTTSRTEVVRAMAARFGALAELPRRPRQVDPTPGGKAADVVLSTRCSTSSSPSRAKRRRASSVRPVALASRSASARRRRARPHRHWVVLLDEYQDTGRPVAAVGASGAPGYGGR